MGARRGRICCRVHRLRWVAGRDLPRGATRTETSRAKPAFASRPPPSLIAKDVFVGTSGWSYRHWRGAFYPERLPASRWFEYYAERFSSVEINSTFYRLPSPSTIKRWREAAPPTFRFAVKGSRLITHARRLDAADATETFLARVAPLLDGDGVVLWQLPPAFLVDLPRLEAFLGSLPPLLRCAFEFRDPSWERREVFELLDHHGAGLVAVSAAGHDSSPRPTGGFAYVRFHGLEGGYAHDYTDPELRPWASYILAAGRGYAYFNNDGLARAPENAARLRVLLN